MIIQVNNVKQPVIYNNILISIYNQVKPKIQINQLVDSLIFSKQSDNSVGFFFELNYSLSQIFSLNRFLILSSFGLVP